MPAVQHSNVTIVMKRLMGPPIREIIRAFCSDGLAGLAISHQRCTTASAASNVRLLALANRSDGLPAPDLVSKSSFVLPWISATVAAVAVTGSDSERATWIDFLRALIQVSVTVRYPRELAWFVNDGPLNETSPAIRRRAEGRIPALAQRREKSKLRGDEQA